MEADPIAGQHLPMAAAGCRCRRTVVAVGAQCHLVGEASAEGAERRPMLVEAVAMRQADLAAVAGTLPAAVAAMPQHRAAVADIAQAEAAVTIATTAATADVTKI